MPTWQSGRKQTVGVCCSAQPIDGQAGGGGTIGGFRVGPCVVVSIHQAPSTAVEYLRAIVVAAHYCAQQTSGRSSYLILSYLFVRMRLIPSSSDVIACQHMSFAWQQEATAQPWKGAAHSPQASQTSACLLKQCSSGPPRSIQRRTFNRTIESIALV